MADLERRFRKLKDAMWDFMVDKDALGLEARKPFVILAHTPGHREFEFRTSPDKLSAFNQWFREQVEADVLSVDAGASRTPAGASWPGPWTTKYVGSAYRQGHVNSYLTSKRASFADSLGVGDQSQEDFLRSAFNTQERLSKIQLLGTRAFEELKGISAQMGADMNRILAQGLADGRNPRQIAEEMFDRITGLTRGRAMTIARTEVIHAHAEGQLDAFEDLGVDELQLNAEWSTAGDSRVCPICLPLEGVVFSVKEARGLIPKHPNCRCSWIPTDEKPKKQKQKQDNKTRRRRDDESITSVAAGFGDIPAAAIIRALATQGWSVDDVGTAFKNLGIKIDAGRLRRRFDAAGPAAQLSPEQWKRLNEARAGIVAPKPTAVPTATPPVVIPKPIKVATVDATGVPKPALKPQTAADYRKTLLERAAQAGPSNDEIQLVSREMTLLTRRTGDLHAKRLQIARSADLSTNPELQAELRRLNAEYDQTWEQWRLLDDKRSALVHQKKEATKNLLDEVLKEENSVAGQISLSHLSAEQRDVMNDILRLIPADKVTEKERYDLAAVTVGRSLRRGISFYRKSERKIFMSQKEGTAMYKKVMAHEFGHHVSYQIPSIIQKQNAFFEARTKGEKVEKLRGYQAVGKKDKFGNVNVYAGRVYEDGRHPEVIAVGIEELWDDPIGFAKKDPEWFDMVISALKGIPET